MDSGGDYEQYLNILRVLGPTIGRQRYEGQTFDTDDGRSFIMIPLGRQDGFGSLVGTEEETEGKHNEGESDKLTLDTTFVTQSGNERDLDESALPVLQSRFPPGVVPSRLKPVVTPGDGKCFLHAVSMFLKGSPYYDRELKKLIIKEFNENGQFYRDTVVAQQMSMHKDDVDMTDELRKEKAERYFKELKAACEGNDWAGLEVAFVLANAIRRPVIIYADKETVSKYGENLFGSGGALLPLRHKPEDCCSKVPILISWSKMALHFVPVIRVVDWGEGNSQPISYPEVRPILVHQSSLSASGDPPRNDDPLSPEELEAMKNYVDYNGEIKKPKKPRLIETNGRWYSNPIDGFPRTINPENGVEYDIVIPVDLGKTVCHLAFNFGENYMDVITNFVAQYCSSNRSALADITDYVRKLLFRLHIATQEYEANRESGIPCVPPSLSDFVPRVVQPSVPTVNSWLSILSTSIECEPSIPVIVPCRFTEELSDRAVNGMVQAIGKAYGLASNSLVEYLFLLVDFMKHNFLQYDSASLDERQLQIVPPISYAFLIPRLAYCGQYKSFELFELFRYFALNPAMCGFFGPSLVEWCVVPGEHDSFCVHYSFIKMLANIFACYGAIETSSGNDVLKDIVESPDYMSYFGFVCRTESPDLLFAISVMFLNIAVMNSFSPMNVAIARLYPRILISALRLRNSRLIRNILIGMSTLIYNDKAASKTLASLKPLPNMLAEAEKQCDASGAPYARFCHSAMTMDEAMFM